MYSHNYDLCLYSSLLFIINIVIFQVYKQYTYSTLFLCLLSTSIIVYSNNNIYTNLLDKIPIIAIVLYGGTLLAINFTKSANKYKYFKTAFIVLSFLTVLYLYYYGYCTSNYCYDKNDFTASIYHSFVHVLTVIAHILIIFV